MTKPNTTRRAFSLIELMVVVVVLAIMAAMVVPELTGRGDMAAMAAARRLMADLEYAQNLAITSQTPVTVTFDLAGNFYRLTNANGQIEHPITHSSSFVVDFDTLAGSAGTRISAETFPGNALTFDVLGAPDNAGSATLTCSSRSYAVSVASVTGRVNVNPGP
jgi:type II secretion system protein H